MGREEAADGAGPAYYASGESSLWRDLRALLHPPYTLWHLSYVVFGAMLARHIDWYDLMATLGAFFLAVGVAAHCLDELRGRPLDTRIPSSVLVGVSVLSLGGAMALGVFEVARVGLVLIPFVIVGGVLVVGYNLELAGGALHNEAGFALSWGAFPVLVGYVVQTGTLSLPAAVAAFGATGLSVAQRRLSSPARLLRRRSRTVAGRIELNEGSSIELARSTLLAPLEGSLKAMSWAVVALALASVLAKAAL